MTENNISNFSNLPKVLAVDFDGVLCEDNFPRIGAPKNKIIEHIKYLKGCGVKIILWTSRCNFKNGEQFLNQAVNWCKAQGLEFDAVNKNIDEVIKLTKSDTRKIYADYYLDDRNITVDWFNFFGKALFDGERNKHHD